MGEQNVGQQALEILKKHAKACAIELVSGVVLDEALDEAKKAIPGGIDDLVIDGLKPALKAAVLAKLQGL